MTRNNFFLIIVFLGLTLIVGCNASSDSQWGKQSFKDYVTARNKYLHITQNLTPSLTHCEIDSPPQYEGCIYHPNGKIYCCPTKEHCTKLLVFNPNDNKTELIDLGMELSYLGPVLAPNRKIYFGPYNSTNILVYVPRDSEKDTFYTLCKGKNGEVFDNRKLLTNGGCLTTNGKIVYMPGRLGRILVVDTKDDTFYFVPPDSLPPRFNTSCPLFEFAGASEGSDGLVYGAPFNYDSVVVFDPKTDKIVACLPLDSSIRGKTKKFASINIGLNGNLYCAPYDVKQCLEIYPLAQKKNPTLFGKLDWLNSNGNAGGYYGGGDMALNGRIYYFPQNADAILEINPKKLSVTKHPINSLSDSEKGNPNKWVGTKLIKDGRLIGIPYNRSDFISISPATSIVLPDKIICERWGNKY